MKKLSNTIKKFVINASPVLILLGVAILCGLFITFGTRSENGSITLDGKDAKIEEYTEKFIEDANDAIYRLMNEDAPTDEATIKEFEEGTGQGAATSIDQVIARRLPDGDTDNGKGWQCSKYTAYLATGRREYSTTHPDYGPVNGKDVAGWLVKNYGWKYIDTPVYGAIGSGGFNTTYGHTAMYLSSTGSNTAMVNDANYVPLTVSTHNMNIAGWVWVVPGDYTPTPAPTPTPTPEPQPTPVSVCNVRYVKKGDTMGKIMRECTGRTTWGAAMRNYANSWISAKTGRSVYYGWTHGNGYGLIAGDTITYVGN